MHWRVLFFCNSISVASFIWPRPYVLMSYPPSLFWKWPHRLVSVSLCKASLKLRPGREEPWDASGLGHEAAGAVIWPNKLFKPLLRALTQSSKRGMITFQKNPQKLRDHMLMAPYYFVMSVTFTHFALKHFVTVIITLLL